MIRKIDFWAQVIIVAAGLLSFIIPLIAYKEANIFSALFLLLLGIWQLISALCITFFSGIQNVKKILSLYWKCTIVCLAVFSSCFFFSEKEANKNDLFLILLIGSTSAGLLIGLYYLYVYKKHLLNAGNVRQH